MKIKLFVLIALAVSTLLFHGLVLLGIAPYHTVWGGRLTSVEEMYRMEIPSLLATALFLFLLMQQGKILRSFLPTKLTRYLLWGFFVLFLLNTLGNLFATSTFEKAMAGLTLINALLLASMLRKQEK